MKLHKVNNYDLAQITQANHIGAIAWKILYPQKKDQGQCRFMLFVRLRPGIVSHFQNMARTGYYPGDKYTDVPAKMLINLLKMVEKRIRDYDRVIIYDNSKEGREKEILKISDDVIETNTLNLYSLMLGAFQMADWLKK